jgi:integrase/recombinase XerD
MSVSPHPKHPGTWIIDYRPDGRSGRRLRLSIPGTYAEAIETENSLRIRAKGMKEITLFPKISEVIPEFMQAHRLDHQPAGAERTARSLAHLLAYFGAYQFTSITADHIEHYKRERLQHVKPNTINTELAALSGLCRWAKGKGYCLKVPEISTFPQKLSKSPLPDIPDQVDIERMIAAIPWPKQGLFYCLYYGGLRKEEACGMTAEMVNLARGTMTIRGKGNKQRIVPVLKYLKPILEKRLDEIETGLLWAGRDGQPLYNIRYMIASATRKSGIKAHITPHSLRHAFAVRAVMAGVHLRTIQMILGHSSSKITEIYTHLAGAQIAEEMERF